MNAYLLLAYDHSTGKTTIDIFSEENPTAQSITGGYEIYAVVQSIENPNALAMMEEELDRLAGFHPGYAKLRDARTARRRRSQIGPHTVTLKSDSSRKLRAMRYTDQTDAEITKFVMACSSRLKLFTLTWGVYEGYLVIRNRKGSQKALQGDWVVMEGNKVSHVVPHDVFDIMFTVV